METWVSEVTTDSWLSQARLVLWVGYDWRLSVRSLLPSSWLCWRLTDRFRSRFMLNSLSDSTVESSSSSSISKAIKSKPDFESSWYVPWPIHSPWSKQRITNQLRNLHLQNKLHNISTRCKSVVSNTISSWALIPCKKSETFLINQYTITESANTSKQVK